VVDQPFGFLVTVALALSAVAAWLCVPPSPRLPPPDVSPGPHPGTPSAPSRSGPIGWRLRATATSGAAVAALLVLPGPLAVVAAVVAGLLVWHRSATWETAAARRRRQRLGDDLPHVVDLLASCLAVGAAPADALARVVPLLGDPTRGELAFWVGRLTWGTDAVTVWSDLARHPQLGRLGAALRRAAESGTPVVDALDRLSEDLRRQRRAEVEERVRQIEVRAALPLGVCLLPAFLLLGVVPLVAGASLHLLGG